MIILYAKYRHFVNVICSFFQRVKYNILFSALHSFLHSPTARPSMRTSFMASAMRIMEGKAGFSARSSIWSANRKTRFRVASPSIRTAATFWVCNPARKVVQYDCRVDCIHFCGQADLWKRSRCANTGGVFFILFWSKCSLRSFTILVASLTRCIPSGFCLLYRYGSGIVHSAAIGGTVVLFAVAAACNINHTWLII